MMKLSIICFTEAGARLSVKLSKELLKAGQPCEAYGSEGLLKSCPDGDLMIPVSTSLSEWTRKQFLQKDGIVFIGAASIAVRAIAPFLKSKAEDPAVVVMDDMGRFSISLLSGHLGGANELAERLAGLVGGQAVITTATDIHGRFAVDLFAKEQGLVITNLKKIKMISSAILKGENVGFHSDFLVSGKLPSGLIPGEAFGANLWITIKESGKEGPLKESLKLVPRLLVLGIGCRKGVPAKTIEKVLDRVFKEWDLSQEALAACASIDLKKEEEGICRFAASKGIPFYTYPAAVLEETEGEFSSSTFVKQITGVDNVCERAALACVKELGGGKLLVKKQAADGVTAAVAVRDWKVQLKACNSLGGNL
ncbi:cobalt-precorrin 5A hydrolase [Lacrimispora celerecrescens]|uniref:cobalt-precorrin 5A hydrolase n=1 Tax=Lacrimispora celerecrescens TaxID=29354 RepID=UPI001FCB99D4|nr:cobalt-precorrin 5A hydrolase [Lacrimispora celerecrescens]